ncbi:hypothetical protein [Deferrisoma camini]|uniref:hypothetical protein n=1 Tax=Deferrisoma camini TaxID=1035120 RepID=UPI00046D4657|nr:hypothetical protein [Deferrisoma camini]
MPPRPVVLCRGACEILEDALGNDVTVLALAVQRMLRAGVTTEQRRYLVMIRERVQRIEARYRGLTPCDRCPGCRRGTMIDVEA